MCSLFSSNLLRALHNSHLTVFLLVRIVSTNIGIPPLSVIRYIKKQHDGLLIMSDNKSNLAFFHTSFIISLSVPCYSILMSIDYYHVLYFMVA